MTSENNSCNQCESITKVKYGCHCDLEDGMEPDDCVIDSNNFDDCIHAHPGMRKEQCEYWRTINDSKLTVEEYKLKIINWLDKLKFDINYREENLMSNKDGFGGYVLIETVKDYIKDE